MSDLIQLVYASRSNIETSADTTAVLPGVARILTQSRRNNKPKNIGGVLCYGDGHFFQCLEGERGLVESLYEHLHEDDRHRDVTLLMKRPIKERRFKLWAMKYLSMDQSIRQELKAAGLSEFDPYRFGETTIARMLTVLQAATEAQPLPSGDRKEPSPSLLDRSLGDGSQLLYLGAGTVLAALVTIGLIAFWIL